jgi:hypothetical protein
MVQRYVARRLRAAVHLPKAGCAREGTMTKMRGGLILIAAILLSVIVATSYAQDDKFTDREYCLTDCRYLRDAYRPGWGPYRGVVPGQSYAVCVQRCENKFWRDVERDVEEN